MALTKVSTDGVKDDAITKTKIPANQIEASELADNAVDTNAITTSAVTNAKIASGAVNTSELTDNAVTHAKYQDIPTSRLLGRTSSGTGNPETLDDATVRAFLGVSAGANQTTINNNADNRVITGSGTANTLEGESTLLYDSTTLTLNKGGLTDGQKLTIKGSGNSTGDDLTINNWGNSDGDYWTIGVNLTADSGGSTAKTNTTLRHSGVILDGRMGRVIFSASETSTATKSDSHTFERDGSIKMKGSLYLNGDTAAANALDDYEEGTWTINTDVGSPNTTHSASYTKIGRSVTVNVYITCPTSSSSSNFRITSLPFQALGGANYFIGATYTQVHTTDNVFVQINAGNNDVYVYKRIGDSVTYADLSGAYLLFTCTYFTG